MTSIKTIVAAAALTAAAFLAAPQAKAANGDYCREYTRTVFIGGRTEQAYGTACLEPDGAWRVADENLNNNGGYDYNNVQPQNVTYVINDGPRRIYQPRIRYVNYDTYYYRPARAYYPAPIFGFYVGNNRGWDRHDRWGHNRWDRHDNARWHH